MRDRIKRFDTRGMAGLEDRPRAGRPPTDTPEQMAKVVAAALTGPETLNLLSASWTLDRQAAYLDAKTGDRHQARPDRRDPG